MAFLLHPSLRLSAQTKWEGVEDRHRLTFAFDDKGNELHDERFIGDEAGQLS